MTKLQFLKGRRTGKLSYNEEEGKLSFCICCCPGLNQHTLHLHWIPADRGCDDPGDLDGISARLTWLPSATFCDVWEYDDPLANEFLVCKDPTGPGQILIGTWVEMRCETNNTFKLDVCWSQDQVSGPPPACDYQILSIRTRGPVQFCLVEPGSGEVFLDFGWVHFPLCGFGCDFRLIVTDTAEPPAVLVAPPLTPFQGLPAPPPAPFRLPPGSGVGTRLVAVMRAQEVQMGCSSRDLFRTFDRWGPERVEADLEKATELFLTTCSRWYHRTEREPVPFRPERAEVSRMIAWACGSEGLP